MIHSSHATRHKAFLSVFALVAFATVLVAQNTPPSKEAAPAGTGQVSTDIQNTQDFQTYHGEEYLIYTKGDTVMQYDPETSKSTPISWVLENQRMLYKGNLGEPEEARREVKDIFMSVGAKTTGLHITTVKTSPVNGNVLVTEDILNSSDQKVTIKVANFNDYVLPIESAIASDGKSYTVGHNPISWSDKTHLLFSKGESDAPWKGLFALNVATGVESMILEPFSYIQSPKPSPSGRYLSFVKSLGEWDPDEWEHAQVLLYDLQTGKAVKIGDPGGIIGWTTKKLATINPADAEFLNGSMMMCPGHCVYLPNTVTFEMPFKCGEAYYVVRDGECLTPAGCGLGDGGYPVLNGIGTNNHHDNRPALDFSDNNMGGSNSDQLPVYAAAGGWVAKAGWENPNCTSCENCGAAAGAGRRVWLKHTDGTFTLYGHMSSLSVSATNHPWVDQGTQLGFEGETGHTIPCHAEHIHFERRTGSGWDDGGQENSYWMQFDELGSGQIPTSGHAYLSKNGPCSGNCCAMPCVNGGTIPACGGTFTGQSTSGSNTRATYFVTTSTGGNLATVNESGPEKMYQITPSITGLMTAKLSNISSGSNLNIVIMTGATCSNLNPLLNCTGTAGTSSNTYTATCNVTANTTYYIIVDGVAGSSGSYTLTVSTPCIPNLTDNGSSRSNSGRNVPLTIKVINNGTGNAVAFATRIWLSTDLYLENGNDYYIAFVNYSNGLAAGFSSTATGTIAIPSNVPAGNYYVLEKIDYLTGNWNGAVSESSENDNAYYLGPGTTFYLPPAFTGGLDDRSDAMAVELDGSNFVQEEQTNTSAVLIPIVQPSISCTASVSGFQISATQVAENSSYILANSLGQIICIGKATDGAVNCVVKNSGIYFLSIIDTEGNKCAQKIFVR